MDLLGKLIFWLAYPLIWLLHPTLVKLRYEGIKNNEAVRGAFCVLALTAITFYACIASFIVFNWIIVAAPEATYEIKREILSTNRGMLEQQQRAAAASTVQTQIQAAEVDYSVPDTTPVDDAQDRIESLKKKMQEKNPD
jgi:bacteriorhodopsin